MFQIFFQNNLRTRSNNFNSNIRSNKVQSTGMGQGVGEGSRERTIADMPWRI
jgi:hypothetical protein